MHGANALRALHVLPPTTEAVIVTAGPVLTADAVAPLAALPALALPFLSDVVVDLDGVSALTQDGFHALLAARQQLGTASIRVWVVAPTTPALAGLWQALPTAWLFPAPSAALLARAEAAPVEDDAPLAAPLDAPLAAAVHAAVGAPSAATPLTSPAARVDRTDVSAPLVETAA